MNGEGPAREEWDDDGEGDSVLAGLNPTRQLLNLGRAELAHTRTTASYLLAATKWGSPRAY